MNLIEGTTPVLVAARDLARILGATIPFAADHEQGLPGIAAVQMRAGEGLLTATATDRYTLGYARADAIADQPVRFVLDVEDARSLRKRLSQTMKLRGSGLFQVVLSIAGQAGRRSLTVDFEPYSFMYVETSTASAPDLGSVLETNRIEPGTVPAAGPTGITARALEPFVKAAKWADLQPLRWSEGEAMKPITVEMGDWFIGLITPTRIADDAKPVNLAVPKIPAAAEDEQADAAPEPANNNVGAVA